MFALLANATRFGRVPSELLEWSERENSFGEITNWLRGDKQLPDEPSSGRKLQ
jgi:hypothetical protein